MKVQRPKTCIDTPLLRLVDSLDTSNKNQSVLIVFFSFAIHFYYFLVYQSVAHLQPKCLISEVCKQSFEPHLIRHKIFSAEFAHALKIDKSHGCIVVLLDLNFLF